MVIIADESGVPAIVIDRDDEFARRRAQGAALDDGDRPGLEVGHGSGHGGPFIDFKGIISGIDRDDTRVERNTGARDGHADKQASGAGHANRRGVSGGRRAGHRGEIGPGAEGLQDAAGDDAQDAAIGNAQQGGTWRAETYGHRRDDILQETSVARDVGDVFAVEHAGQRIARYRRHGDDIGADAGREIRVAGGVGDRRGGAEDTE